MVEANRADLFVEMGLQLELWSEQVINGSRNARIRPGSPGHVFAAEGIPTMEVPAVLTRAQGDIHPFGNPHVNLSPLSGKVFAANVANGLKRVDPAGADVYDANARAFQDRIDREFFGEELVKLVKPEQLERLVRAGKLFEYLDSKDFGGSKLASRLGGWLGKTREIRGAKIVSHHKNWPYFARDFGIEVVGEIEPKPGLTPTPAHVSDLKELIRRAGVKLVIHAPYYPADYAAELAAETGIREVTMPTMVGGVPGADDYFAFFDVLTDRLVANL
jgi:ABC-type Zn uptake system ZnuABC Zn-binding protein ZnuA